MTKKTTTLTINDNIIQEAKKNFLNMSEIAENAIRDKLGKKDVEIDTIVDECEFCGKKEKQATYEDSVGLSWIYPDERWICNSCLKSKGRYILK
jgi:hypothetical protein